MLISEQRIAELARQLRDICRVPSSYAEGDVEDAIRTAIREAGEAAAKQQVDTLSVVRRMIRCLDIEHAVVDLNAPDVGLGDWIDAEIRRRLPE